MGPGHPAWVSGRMCSRLLCPNPVNPCGGVWVPGTLCSSVTVPFLSWVHASHSTEALVAVSELSPPEGLHPVTLRGCVRSALRACVAVALPVGPRGAVSRGPPAVLARPVPCGSFGTCSPSSGFPRRVAGSCCTPGGHCPGARGAPRRRCRPCAPSARAESRASACRVVHAAQHHGVLAGARREDRRPGVQVRGAGGALQSLLQNGGCRWAGPGTPSCERAACRHRQPPRLAPPSECSGRQGQGPLACPRWHCGSKSRWKPVPAPPAAPREGRGFGLAPPPRPCPLPGHSSPQGPHSPGVWLLRTRDCHCPSVARCWDSVHPHTFTLEGGGQRGGVSEQDPRLSGNSVFSGTAFGDVAGNRRASPARCPCLSARLPPQQGSGGTRAGCVSPRVPVPLPLRALVPRAPSAVRAALRSGYRFLCRLLLSSSLSFSRPGNKTRAVQSCDRSQQRSLHGSHRHSIRTAAPGGEGGRAAWQSGQTRLPLRLEERRAGGRDPGWGSFKFTCLVSEKKV